MNIPTKQAAFRGLKKHLYLRYSALLCFFTLLNLFSSFAREWRSPEANQTFRPGDIVHVFRIPDSMDRKQRVVIYHTFGTKDGKPFFGGSDGEELKRVHFEVPDCKNDLQNIDFTFQIPCNRTGEFKISVSTQQRTNGSACFYNPSTSENRLFYVAPAELRNVTPFEGPIITCPGQDRVITINNPDPNFWQTVKWFDSPVISGATHLGFTRKVTLANLEERTYYVQFFRNNNGCIDSSLQRTPIIIIAADKIPLPTSPNPDAHLLCKAAEFQLEVPPAYDGANWYESNSSVTPVLSGPFAYKRFFNERFAQINVEYFKIDGGCKRYSLRVPINISVLPDTPIDRLPFQDLKIYDHRDFNSACFDDPEFFRDLNDGINLNNLTTALNTGIGTIITNFNANPLVKIEYLGKSDFFWTPRKYTELNQKALVCADDISSTAGKYNSNLYGLNTSLSYKYAIFGLNNEQVTSKTLTCEIKNLAQKKISTRPPGTGSVEETCIPPSESLVRKLLDSQNKCSSLEIIAACPESTNKIGPIGPSLPTDTYTWTPATGLSNANIRNPSIRYQDIPGRIREISEYTLETTPLGGGVISNPTKHCTFIYKCFACGKQDPSVFVNETKF